jgi:uncharacterized protein YegJ (DUF2314 family)
MEILGMVCKECAEERKAKTQQDIDRKMSELKDKFDKGYDKGYKIWLKVKLTCEHLNEHVWIRVTDINLKDSTFCGIIDNDIVWVSEKYSCGDNVVMGFDNIEDIIEEGNYL